MVQAAEGEQPVALGGEEEMDSSSDEEYEEIIGGLLPQVKRFPSLSVHVYSFLCCRSTLRATFLTTICMNPCC
jgi:hypothetical protein